MISTNDIQKRIEQEFTEKNIVYPNMIYNLSSVPEFEVQRIRKQLQKPDFIDVYSLPITVQTVSCTVVLFSFQPYMKRVYQDYKKLIIYEQKFPCTSFEKDIQCSEPNKKLNYEEYKRGVFVFPQKIGQKLNAFVNDCAYFKNNKIKNVAFIDLEMYDQYEISEIGIVVMDLHEKVIKETFCSLVARDNYNKELNTKSAYYIYKNVNGIPFLQSDLSSEAKNNMVSLSEAFKQARTIDKKYNIELFLAKDIKCEKQHIDVIFDRKCTIMEVYPLIYSNLDNFSFLNTQRSQDDIQHRCKFHQQVYKSKHGEYHCALQDVYMYAALIQTK